MNETVVIDGETWTIIDGDLVKVKPVFHEPEIRHAPTPKRKRTRKSGKFSPLQARLKWLEENDPRPKYGKGHAMEGKKLLWNTYYETHDAGGSSYREYPPMRVVWGTVQLRVPLEQGGTIPVCSPGSTKGGLWHNVPVTYLPL